MTEQLRQNRSADRSVNRDATVGNSANGNSGITFNTGGDATFGDGNLIANGDITQDNSQHTTKNTLKQRHPVGFALLVLLAAGTTVGGGVALTQIGGGSGGDGVDTSVVSEPGARGATDTARQIRAAEKAGDPAAWCTLAAPTDSGCQNTMGGQFQRRSQSYRDRVDQVQIGTPRLSGTSAQVPVSWNGKEQGTVPLTWSGGRWQMGSGYAAMTELAGGVFLSLVDSQSGQLTLGGIPLP
ncbi:hypothetical protein ACFOSC_09155 [Streptantibioticus rubrisoli]|uniref:Uncharacterized protein n=1 Tax=Streptantibioticus rubrisoli TaxID=1387313 RepID=A0ABT1P671_9ACTN|nr:hypothetical protein [Streptantibioticus rubrisoli]MCQ4040879.1 hypothetical protein [Streptantibioticus rubrisoli]